MLVRRKEIMQIRKIDLKKPNKERKKEAERTNRILFQLRSILPFSKEYDELIYELFNGEIGENCFIGYPLYMNLAAIFMLVKM